MKAIRNLLATLGFSILLASPAYANDPGSCGLPSLAINNKTVNILVNFITSMPTYTIGVTLGTSKCNGIAMMEQERLQYVQSSYDDLAEEAAQGGGAHLDTLASLMGCPVAQNARFTKITGEKFAQLFTIQPEPQAFLQRLRGEMGQDQALKGCLASKG